MDIVKQADINLRESIKNIGENAPKGEVIENENYMLTTIGLNTTESHANAVFSLDDSNPEKVFKESNDFFKKRGFDYIFWIGEARDHNMEKYLKKLGYEPSREPGTPLMVIDRRLEIPKLDIDTDLKKVESQGQINDYIDLVDECFELGEEVARDMFNSSNVLNSRNNAAYLIYYKGKAVSGVQIYRTDDVAGIYWVATREEMRGKGLGKYISALGTNTAFDMGVDKVILQASKLGKYVYDRIGYDLIGYYRTYKIEDPHPKPSI